MVSSLVVIIVIKATLKTIAIAAASGAAYTVGKKATKKIISSYGRKRAQSQG